MKQIARVLVAALVAAGLFVQAGTPATAENTQSLGMSVFRDIVVDQAHDRVFVSGGSVVAADLDGNVIGPVPGISAARQMTLSPDGSKLVVANGDFLSVVDPVGLTVIENIPTGVASCPEAVAVSSGKVFFTYGDCVAVPGLGAVDLTTKAVTTGLTTGGVPFLAQLVSVPGAPSLIAARYDGGESWSSDRLVLFDTTGGATPSTTVRSSKVFAPDVDVRDLALVPDGSAVVVASGGSGSNVYSTTDFSQLGTYAGSGGPAAAAIRSDGMVAIAVNPYDAPDIRFFPAGSATPVRQVDLGKTASGDAISVQLRGLAFGAKRAYAVTTTGALRTLTAGPAPTLQISTDKTLYGYGASATVKATLGTTTDRTVSIYRTPVGGSRVLVTTGTVDPVTGALVAHVSNLTQNVTYEAVFAGDDDYAPKTAKVVVKVAAKVTISTASKSMSSYFHKLPHTPAPVVSVAALPIKPTTVCVKFVAQTYRSGAWRSFGSISCPKRSTSTGRYGVTMYDFPAGTRMRVQASYPLTTQNAKTTSKWYYILFV